MSASGVRLVSLGWRALQLMRKSVRQPNMLRWFRRSTSRPATMHVVHVSFLAEQDGPAERELKSALTVLFGRLPTVRRAYLARVSYHAMRPQDVALCLAAPTSPELVSAVGDVFAPVFNASQHLDIYFLRDAEEEAALARVCRPFYGAA